MSTLHARANLCKFLGRRADELVIPTQPRRSYRRGVAHPSTAQWSVYTAINRARNLSPVCFLFSKYSRPHFLYSMNHELTGLVHAAWAVSTCVEMNLN